MLRKKWAITYAVILASGVIGYVGAVVSPQHLLSPTATQTQTHEAAPQTVVLASDSGGGTTNTDDAPLTLEFDNSSSDSGSDTSPHVTKVDQIDTAVTTVTSVTTGVANASESSAITTSPTTAEPVVTTTQPAPTTATTTTSSSTTPSTTTTTTTAVQAPVASTQVKAAASSSTSVTITWAASTSTVTSTVTKYEIWRGDGNYENWVRVGSVNGSTLTFTDITVHSGSTYTYGIRAFNAAGLKSDSSPIARVTTH